VLVSTTEIDSNSVEINPAFNKDVSALIIDSDIVINTVDPPPALGKYILLGRIRQVLEVYKDSCFDPLLSDQNK